MSTQRNPPQPDAPRVFAFGVLVQMTGGRAGVMYETVALDAYTVQDALYQAVVETIARYGGAESGLTTRVVSIAPLAVAAARFERLAEELRLLAMPEEPIVRG